MFEAMRVYNTVLYVWYYTSAVLIPQWHWIHWLNILINRKSILVLIKNRKLKYWKYYYIWQNLALYLFYLTATVLLIICTLNSWFIIWHPQLSPSIFVDLSINAAKQNSQAGVSDDAVVCGSVFPFKFNKVVFSAINIMIYQC